MKQTIKAIETHYKGFRFRSRTEARWAVFFDALGVKWRYEMDDFMLPSGRYLVDFYFPDYDCYGEVKPGNFSGDCRHEELVEMVKKPLLLFVDVPGVNPQFIMESDVLEPQKGYAFASSVFCQDFGVFLYGWEEMPSYFTNPYDYAVNCSRAARFEFGETRVPDEYSEHHNSYPSLSNDYLTYKDLFEIRADFDKAGNVDAYKTLPEKKAEVQVEVYTDYNSCEKCGSKLQKWVGIYCVCASCEHVIW